MLPTAFLASEVIQELTTAPKKSRKTKPVKKAKTRSSIVKLAPSASSPSRKGAKVSAAVVKKTTQTIKTKMKAKASFRPELKAKIVKSVAATKKGTDKVIEAAASPTKKVAQTVKTVVKAKAKVAASPVKSAAAAATTIDRAPNAKAKFGKKMVLTAMKAAVKVAASPVKSASEMKAKAKVAASPVKSAPAAAAIIDKVPKAKAKFGKQMFRPVVKTTHASSITKSTPKAIEKEPSPLAKKTSKNMKFKTAVMAKRASSIVTKQKAMPPKDAAMARKPVNKAKASSIIVKSFPKSFAASKCVAKDQPMLARNASKKTDVKTMMRVKSGSIVVAKGKVTRTKGATKTINVAKKVKTRSIIIKSVPDPPARGKVAKEQAKVKAYWEKEIAKAKALQEKLKAKARAAQEKARAAISKAKLKAITFISREQQRAKAEKEKAKAAATAAREEARADAKYARDLKKYEEWKTKEHLDVLEAIAKVAKLEAESRKVDGGRPEEESEQEEEATDEEEE